LCNREVEISRIKVRKRQTFETLINEEALLLAKFLRNEKEWIPRISNRLMNVIEKFGIIKKPSQF